MAKPSKEEKILELFMNEPAKHWHFSDIVKTSKVSENIAGKWLRKFQKDRVILRAKQKGRMPYFTADYSSPAFKSRKRLYAMQKMHDSGLLSSLYKMDAKAVIVFGSYARADWTSESDVDIFIYGNAGYFEKPWKGLGFQGRPRTVQVHMFRTKKELYEVRSGLLRNVLKGYIIKGDVSDVLEAAS